MNNKSMLPKRRFITGAVLLVIVAAVILLNGSMPGKQQNQSKAEETEIIAVINLMGTGYGGVEMYETKCRALYDGSNYYFKSYSYAGGRWMGSFFKWDGALKDGRIAGEGTLSRYSSDEEEVTVNDIQKEAGISYSGNFVNGLPDGVINVQCQYGSHLVTGIMEFTEGRITGLCESFDETGKQIEYRDTVGTIPCRILEL